MTISLLGRCEETGMLGMVIASSAVAVAGRSTFARAGVGVVASQNLADPRLGPRGLDLLENGLDPDTALASLLAEAEHAEYRQLLLLDADGASASFSGDQTLGYHATASGENCVAAGNLLANDKVPKSMVDAFVAIENSFANRLLSAMEAGLVAGGEAGPVRSAGLLIVHVQPWPLVDLRVDWCEGGPIAELRTLWQRFEPKMDDFVTRALDPASAPPFGVPGEER